MSVMICGCMSEATKFGKYTCSHIQHCVMIFDVYFL